MEPGAAVQLSEVSGMSQPPETYSQWLEYLHSLRTHPENRQLLLLAADGKLRGPAPEQLAVQLSETVGILLTCCCRRFLRQTDQALAEGEAEMLPILAARFRRRLAECLLYRALPALGEARMAELEDGFARRIRSFWADYLRQLRRTACSSEEPALEDAALLLGRMDIWQERRIAQSP